MNTPQDRTKWFIAILSFFAVIGIIIFSANLSLKGGYALIKEPSVQAAVSFYVPVDLPGVGEGSSIETEQQLLSKNISATFDQSPPYSLAGSLDKDPARRALVEEILEVTRSYRLVNALPLNEINGSFNQLEASENEPAPIQAYDDPVQVEQAIMNTWNENYANVTTFDQMLMPEGIQNIQTASQYATELLTHTLYLGSDTNEKNQSLYPFGLKGKNWLKVTFNTHGYRIPDGDNALLSIEQPAHGILYSASLANYAEPGSPNEQTAYIPVSELKHDENSLNMDEGTGTLHIHIWIEPAAIVEIDSISAFYFEP